MNARLRAAVNSVHLRTLANSFSRATIGAPSQGKSIDNVALSGDSLMLSWTHDRAQRLLKLR